MTRASTGRFSRRDDLPCRRWVIGVAARIRSTPFWVPNGWRDWIVRSLNKGQGYDRMLQEMQAAVPEAVDLAKETEATTKLYGLDNRLLEIPGRKRLEIDHGQVIHDVLA